MKNLIVFGALVMFASNVPAETVDSAEGSNDQQMTDDIVVKNESAEPTPIAEDFASGEVDP